MFQGECTLFYVSSVRPEHLASVVSCLIFKHPGYLDCDVRRHVIVVHKAGSDEALEGAIQPQTVHNAVWTQMCVHFKYQNKIALKFSPNFVV